jgi:hypothetical protein
MLNQSMYMVQLARKRLIELATSRWENLLPYSSLYADKIRYDQYASALSSYFNIEAVARRSEMTGTHRRIPVLTGSSTNRFGVTHRKVLFFLLPSTLTIQSWVLHPPIEYNHHI